MRLLILACLVVGCAAPDDPCRVAAEHVASCTHEPVTNEAQRCDPERADQILDMDCDQLAAAAAAGKADGWWDEFLCGLGFVTHCSLAPGSSTSATRTLAGNVYKLGTTTGVDHVYVRATREGTAETKGAWTVAGIFTIGGLAPARYTIEVAFTTTSTAVATQKVDVSSQSYVVIYAPVP